MYLSRTLETHVVHASNTFPVVLLTGPRQVGKTTLLQQLVTVPRRYISLDKLSVRDLAKQDPELFLQRYPAPVLIDEIQYAPELLPYIKAQVDTQRQNGLYWLTGSQQFNLMQQVTESLAGRVAILTLQGLSQAEKLGGTQVTGFLPSQKYLQQRSQQPPSPLPVQQLFQLIWRGSFPHIYTVAETDWEVFYGSYVQTYIERDVRSIQNITDASVFRRFMRLLAARTGQLVNYEELSRTLGISSPTVKAWLNILQVSNLVYLLEPYYINLSKRMTKMCKLYFLDTGLACYLSGWSSAQSLEFGAMNGAMLETYAVSEILKSYWHQAKCPPVSFYRDKDGHEIDVLLEQDNVLYPMEIKLTAQPRKEDTRNFKVLQSLGPKVATGTVLCLTEEYLPISAMANAVPISYLS